MTGFGPFRDTETIDFDTYAETGIFLISGRTGAGKSSILDAITFGLFGRIPRYEGQAGERVRSDYLDPAGRCQVQVEFSTVEHRYKVSRSPEYLRPKQRGDGTTKVKAEAELAIWSGSDWQVLESQARNAGIRIAEVVQLSAAQFEQVILLAQGKFQEFLVADSNQRRDLLRTLFGTRRFADYAEDVDQRAKTLREAVGQDSAALAADVTAFAEEARTELPPQIDTETGAGVLPWCAELMAAQAAATAAAEQAEKAARAERDQAVAALHSAEVIAEHQARLAAARLRHSALLAQAEDIADAAAVLAAARRAELVWPVLVRLEDQARPAHRRALAAQQTALAGFVELMAPADLEQAELEALATQLAGTAGALQEALAAEASLPQLADDLRLAEAAHTGLEADQLAGQQRAEGLRAQRGEILAQLEKVADTAADLPRAEAALQAQQDRLAAAHQAAAIAEALHTARREALSAADAVSRAAAHRADLLRRQLAGQAANLAAGLVEAQPCPVCGSPDHPVPATATADQISQTDVERADAEVVSAQQRSAGAGEVVAGLVERERLALAAARGSSVTDCESAVRAAQEVRDTALTARTELDQLNRRRSELDAELDRVQDGLSAGQSAREQSLALVAACQERLAAQRERVADARGEATSVAERLNGLQAQLTVTTALLAANRELAAAVGAVETATAELAHSLHQAGFADPDQVRAARLEPRRFGELDAKVAEHHTALRAVEDLLAEPVLQDLPADPVDVAAPGQAAATATERYEARLRENSVLFQQTVTLTRRHRAIIDRLERSEVTQQRYQVVNRLAASLRGQPPNLQKMSLETFVLAAELEDIVAAANGRFREMTEGRYEFLHSDALAGRGAQSGLRLEVLDAHTGRSRSPESLSGGEQFQASLALALGLAEVVTNRAGGMRLDTLFVDEGFGSLSEETLQVTMATLDGLRAGGRVVGLISHVQSMKEAIGTQLQVRITDAGWSTIDHN